MPPSSSGFQRPKGWPKIGTNAPSAQLRRLATAVSQHSAKTRSYEIVGKKRQGDFDYRYSAARRRFPGIREQSSRYSSSGQISSRRCHAKLGRSLIGSQSFPALSNNARFDWLAVQPPGRPERVREKDEDVANNFAGDPFPSTYARQNKLH